LDLEPDRRFQEESAYRSNVIGAVYASVAFLEASINEVFLDAAFSTKIRKGQVIPSGTVESLRPDVVEDIAREWPTIERSTIFIKYNLALALNCKRAICASNPKRKAADTLKTFRNLLTHPKPKWIRIYDSNKKSLASQKKDAVSVESRIKALIESDKKRPPAGYHHETSLVHGQFPTKYLNATLAKIAVKSCLEFDNEFCHRMGIKNKETRRPLMR